MPTGYTSGIIDGKITTFQQFAKLCMRAFGATIHMRDESMDAEYTPDKPSEYYPKEIAKTKKLLAAIESASDKKLIADYKKELAELQDDFDTVVSDKVDLEKEVSNLQDELDIHEYVSATEAMQIIMSDYSIPISLVNDMKTEKFFEHFDSFKLEEFEEFLKSKGAIL
jgi:hypothetical protein